MKKRILLLILMALSLTVTACQHSDAPDTPQNTNGTQATEPVTDHEEPESPAEPEAPEYPWLAPEIEPLGYEEFFAQERAYYDPDALWYGYTRAKGSFWRVESGDFYTAYELVSDENGFYICEYNDWENPIHRIPNTEELADCGEAITNTRKLFCVQNGTLLSVDVLTGQLTTLYTAEHIPDMELCHNDVLYFLAVTDGILCLNRLYLPTMTLDLLYAQTAPEVPASCYRLTMPATNLSTIIWETINPVFWQEVCAILEGSESEYPELTYPSAFTLTYIAEHPFIDEAVQHNFARLQDELNLRPRMKGYYDPVADACEEKYGIYDVCFFGTGVHDDAEHFESYPEYHRTAG